LLGTTSFDVFGQNPCGHISCRLLEEPNKNSSGDEIANVNFFTTISHTYFKTPKSEPILFNKLDDS